MDWRSSIVPPDAAARRRPLQGPVKPLQGPEYAPRSEQHLQAELDHARPGELAGRGAESAAGRIGVDAPRRELRVVQRVDRLGAELEASLSPGSGVLHHRNIPVVRAVRANPAEPRREGPDVRAELIGVHRSKPALMLNQRSAFRWSLGSGMFFRSPMKMALPKPRAAPLCAV